MKKLKRGFTLIELIAVIIVLGIISLVVIFIVGNIVEEFRRNAYKTSVLHLFNAIETYTYINGNSELMNNEIEVNKINTLDKNPFKTGIVFLNDKGNYEISDVSDGNYCASGEEESIIVIKGACDVEKPTISTTVNKNVASIVFADNKELAGYACIEGIEEPSIWNEISGKEQSITCTFESENTYSIWVKDTSNNKNSEEIIMTKANFCDYAEGYSWTYNYTGKIEAFTTPCNGTYKLEVWGAQGGLCTAYGNAPGGKGGYSYGDKDLEKGNMIFIGVGGQGATSISTDNNNAVAGGYNGGGNGNNRIGNSNGGGGSAGGGGATHIAINTNRGTLVSYASYKNEILLIAGGGGGGSVYGFWDEPTGYNNFSYSGGSGNSTATSSTFGKGDGCGGGGYYGGRSAAYMNWSGGGGTGYIGGVVNGGMTAGSRTGNGTAKITLVTLK